MHVGERFTDEVIISVMAYGAESLHESRAATAEEALARRDGAAVTWIDVSGVHQPDVVASFGRLLSLHPLTQEDILHTGQRPKEEAYPNYHYIVVRMLSTGNSGEIVSEQLSMILASGLLVTFQERPGDVFDPVRCRIREGGGRLRSMGADYLAYRLMDAVVDNCFPLLEAIGDRVESLEDTLVSQAPGASLAEIHDLKRSLVDVRKSVWPLREVISALSRDDSPLVGEGVRLYLRDLYDHVIQLMDATETNRDMVSGMLDIYLSSVSNRMNEVMKVLTIMSTIFIPLTFIAGVYGMNFRHMPELERTWGYPMALGIMAATAIGMVIYFRRRRWF
jgi:magnesium transporter